MNYIQNHYKSITFNVIKTHINSINIDDSYIIFIKIIQELHNHFNNFDKFTLCDAELYNPTFIIKNNKIFNQFYTRFSVIITPLNYDELSKIHTLQRLLTSKLRNRIINNKPTFFHQYVKRAQIIDQNIHLYTRQIDIKEIKKKKFYKPRNTITKDSIIDYSSDFKTQLKGRYFKCLIPGHRPDPDAPCANTQHLSYEEAKAKLAREIAVEKD